MSEREDVPMMGQDFMGIMTDEPDLHASLAIMWMRCATCRTQTLVHQAEGWYLCAGCPTVYQLRICRGCQQLEAIPDVRETMYGWRHAIGSGACGASNPSTWKHGVKMRQLLDMELVCPHCHFQGAVTTTEQKVKQGISGGKATGAILTGGWSLLATGLARKRLVTEANCGHCGVRWFLN